MKKIGFLLGTLALAAAVAQARKMKGDDLSNLIIQGENRLKVAPRSPDMDWSADLYKEMPALLENHTLLSELTGPAISKPPMTLPDKSASSKTARPWLESIQEAPILTLRFSAPSQKEPRQWVLLVKDSRGKVFYELRKKSLIPKEIAWDGFGNAGPLHVGYDYTYTFSLMDRAGNPQRYAGKPFKIEAFRYLRGGKVYTSLDPETLFASASGSRLSEQGTAYLHELQDQMRLVYGARVDVEYFDNDQKFGTTRAENIREFLVRSLDWPEDLVTAAGKPVREGYGYKHVDIIVK